MGFVKIDWSESFTIGNLNIDNDHKKIIEIINELVDLIESDWNREEFARILSEMTDYSMKHFKKEETYMHEFSYPELSEHRKKHAIYVRKVAMFNIDLLGNNPPKPDEVIEFLKNWWKDHILAIDTKYEQFRNNNNLNANYPCY